ncbi:hypothetical protein F4604DRAFT_1823438 [Suillus subluteus]|nr:hypothetical protein F4604DRAFT_1823438 [Suillus subluteus]
MSPMRLVGLPWVWCLSGTLAWDFGCGLFFTLLVQYHHVSYETGRTSLGLVSLRDPCLGLWLWSFLHSSCPVSPCLL